MNLLKVHNQVFEENFFWLLVGFKPLLEVYYSFEDETQVNESIIFCIIFNCNLF